MRVADGNAGDVVFRAADDNRCIDDLFHIGIDGNILCRQIGASHIDRDGADLAVTQIEVQLVDAGNRFDRQIFGTDIAHIVEILRNTADVVAAHLTFRTVTVEGTHLCICNGRTLDQNDTVAADAVVRCAVADAQGFGTGDLVVEVFNIDIVVAAGMHLDKRNLLSPQTHVVDVDKLGVRAGEAGFENFRKCICRIERGQTRNTELHRAQVKLCIIAEIRILDRTCIDDIVERAGFHQLLDFLIVIGVGNGNDIDAELGNCLCGAGGCINGDTEIVEPLCERNGIEIVVFFNGEQHAASLCAVERNSEICRSQTLEQRFCHRLTDTENFTRGLHFRTEDGVCVVELFKGEDGNLDRVVRRRSVKTRAVAEICQLFAEHDLCRKVDHRNIGNLGDIRNGSRCTRVDLDDIQLTLVNEVLDVDKTLGAQRQRQLFGAVADGLDVLVGEVERRVNGDGVTGVNACAFDVFHDTGDEDVFTVGDNVDFQLGTGHILVDENGVVDTAGEDHIHIVLSLLVRAGDGHVLTADDVGRTEENGIAECVCRMERFFDRLDTHTLGAAESEGFKQFVKSCTVFCEVNTVSGRTEDTDTLPVKELRQLDCRLTAERNDDTDGLFDLDDVHDIFGRERFKVQSVGRVVVGGNGFGVVVDDNNVITHLLQRPDTVDRGIVKFDTLTDTDRTGAENHDNGLAGSDKAAGFACRVGGGVEIRGLCTVFSGTGINHLVAECALFGHFVNTAQTLQRRVGVAELLCFSVIFKGQTFLCKTVFKVCEVQHAGKEPTVDLGDFKDLVDGHTGLQCFKHGEQAAVVLVMETLADRLVVQGSRIESIKGDLRTADSLHQRHFKGRTDGHDLTRCLHLGAELTGRACKFIKGPLGELTYNIVNRRLKACDRLAGNVVVDFVQRIAECQLRRDLCDRITGCLGSKCGGTGDTRVDFNNGVFKAVGVQRKLTVTAADDTDGGNDIKRCRTEHLIFLVGKRQSGRNDDRVTGMDTDGVDVFHGADSNDVAGSIAHGFKLDFLPAGDALLDENLRDRGHIKTGTGDDAQLFFVIRNTAAGAAERECGTDNDGITDLIRNGDGGFDIVCDFGRNARLTDFLHGIAEQLSVLCLINRLNLCTEQTDTVLLQRTVTGQLHRNGKTRLTAKTCQQCVGTFLFDDTADGLGVQRFQINRVR